MGLTSAERADLRIRIAATLAERGRSGVDLTLSQFGVPTTAEDCPVSLEAGELEEYIVDVLEQDNDDRRLEDLDYDLHAKGLADDLAEELEIERSIPGAPSTFASILSEGPHYLVFKETRDRIKAVRIYVNLLAGLVEQATTLVDPAEVYKAARSQGPLYLRDRPADFEEAAQRALLAREFSLVAWGSAFIYCFSILERFVAHTVAIAAHLRHRPVPSKVRYPKVQSRIAILESLGFKLAIPPQTMSEIRALRLIRNNLVHELSLVENELPPELGQDREREGDDTLPTPELVRRALRAVNDVVSTAEATFEIYASDAAIGQYARPGRVD